MISLSQEKREELTAFINASIEQRCTVYTIAKQRELEALRDKVAMASMMSEPLSEEASESLISMVSYALSHRLCMGMDEGFKSLSPEVEHDFVNEIRRFISSGERFYTTPPVPEIKLPEYKRNGKPLNILAELVWAECLDEIKRLNGLGE